MSALAGSHEPLGRAVGASARRRAQAVARPTSRSGALAPRLIAFAALAAFATAHWATLVTDPPVAGLAAAVLGAVALGAGLDALARRPLRRGATTAAASAATFCAALLMLVLAGLPAGLLEPVRWDELAVLADRGLAGLRAVEWPYAGEDDSVRVVIVLGAPVLLASAAALSFWPARRGAATRRALGLLALLLLYGFAVTEHDPGAPLLRGAALLALVAAWLWLPRISPREAVPAMALVLAAGALSLPFAARLDSGEALIDYHTWSLVGGKDVSFDWNHSYGPLDWPRDGTTLLNVRARRAHYWKAQTLDRFDGRRWLRSSANEGTRPLAELPPRPDRRWDERVRVTVRALSTDFVVAAGTPYLVKGAGEAVSGSADGTVRRLEQPLSRGDSYSVRTYAPDPSASRMRAARGGYPADLRQYTALTLPAAGAEPSGEPVEVPLRGAPGGDLGRAARRLAGSPYRRTYRLARRLALGAPTVYDIAKRMERHLERSYEYSERPPSRALPLEAFLFGDRIGYCQQFSGAMALMLRMVGVPARVVSGFAPGSLNRDTGEYRVRDLDAHSWVEVYFNGIGWVTFDPTPPDAPAGRPEGGADPATRSGDGAVSIRSAAGGAPRAERPARPPDGAAAEGPGRAGRALPLLPAALALALALISILVLRRVRRPSPAADASLAELRRALPRLGWDFPAGTTLLQLERRLARAAGPCAASYVARLRGGRFDPAGARGPAPADRRALRRELTARRGLRARLRGFVVLPPFRRS